MGLDPFISTTHNHLLSFIAHILEALILVWFRATANIGAASWTSHTGVQIEKEQFP